MTNECCCLPTKLATPKTSSAEIGVSAVVRTAPKGRGFPLIIIDNFYE